MYHVFVYNRIDYSEIFKTTNAWVAVLLAIAALKGPCRSGTADIFFKE